MRPQKRSGMVRGVVGRARPGVLLLRPERAPRWWHLHCRRGVVFSEVPLPRIRSIKPEIWGNQKLGQCSRDARLLFIGLITQADDHGLFPAHEAGLAGAIFPFDRDRLRITRRAISELAHAHLIRTYEHPKGRFGLLEGWSEHQQVSHPGKSRYPQPTDPESKPLEILRSVSGDSPESSDRIEDRGSRIEDQGSLVGPPRKKGPKKEAQSSLPGIPEPPPPERTKSWQEEFFHEIFQVDRRLALQEAGLPGWETAEAGVENYSPAFINVSIDRMVGSVADGAPRRLAFTDLCQAYFRMSGPAGKTPPWPFRYFAADGVWRKALRDASDWSKANDQQSPTEELVQP